MKNLFLSWRAVKKELSGRRIMLFLDYDGTLAPIAGTPEKARIPPEVKKILNKLAKNPKYKLAVISGRAVENIKNIIGLKEIIYSGNHGLEIEGPKIKFKPLVSPGYKMILGRIKNDLEQKISSIRGAFVEDKGLSLSLHYRLADKRLIPRIKTIFHETVILYLIRNKIKIKAGKMVLEVRPPIEWDKGKVVLWLLARWRFKLGGKDIVPVYIGDDLTDEDAFRALKNKGITIFVGRPKESCAAYYLKNTAEVKEFLQRLREISERNKLWQS